MEKRGSTLAKLGSKVGIQAFISPIERLGVSKMILMRTIELTNV